MKKNILLFVSTLLLMTLFVSCPQDPDALPKGVYRLTIKGGASLEQDKEIYYSTSENEWYTSKEITDANKLASKKLYGDKVPEGYSFVIKFNDENEKSIVGEKVAFTGAKVGETTVLDATGELKLTSLTESKTAVLSFASPTSEPTAQALPYKVHKGNDLFLGWSVNSDSVSPKSIKAEAKSENIAVPYTPKKGEVITLDSSWTSFSTPNGAYSYKVDEKEKAVETFQKNYSIIWNPFAAYLMSVYPKSPEGVAKQVYPEYEGEIYSFDNVSFEVEIPIGNTKKVAIKNASGIIAQCVYGKGADYYSGNFENYINMTFTIDEKLPIYNMYVDGEGYGDEKNCFELSPKTYKVEAYFIGTRDSKDPMRIIPDSTKIWVVENGKSYIFKDVDLTPDVENKDPQKPTTPTTPEPSDSDKAILSDNEKYLVKNVLTAPYSKQANQDGVVETTTQTGVENSLGGDVLKNGTFKIQVSKNSEKIYASGLFNNKQMEVEFNSVTNDGVSYASSIEL